MLNATAAIVFIVIFALEAAVIITGNVFTIFVFKTQSRLHLKRTCLLLINLAVADLLVGVGQVAVLIKHKLTGTENGSLSASWAFQAFGSCVSVMFLALISLERVYAVFRPLRHCVTSAQSNLHFQHRYRLSSWIVHWWTVFFDCISLQSGYRLCRCRW